MKSKRRSKTMEQQARYYEVPDMEIYMYETYLNGNFSDLKDFTRNSTERADTNLQLAACIGSNSSAMYSPRYTRKI